MCGICGILSSAADYSPDEPLLRRMQALLEHRGPDDEGILLKRVDGSPPLSVGLAHRRLSIIDLAGGRQPMSNEDGAVSIVFNGEIYNFRQLREQLEAGGHRFKTNSDTEVIVHLYEDKGEDCVKSLRGMFAFALWDSNNRRLFMARDRLGQKPLYYWADDARRVIAFASELKSLLCIPELPRQVSAEAIDHYLTYQYVPHPLCIVEGVRKLPPAHTLTWESGRLRQSRYWTPLSDEASGVSRVEAAERLEDLLRESVRLRLVSDVPLGAFLSGGLDSSVTVALMAELASGPVRTFSIGFQERGYDEARYARLVAERFGTDHTEMTVRPDARAILPKLAWHYDEPFADSSAIPTYYVAQLSRRHVTVALTGDAGDECLAGYRRYGALWAGGKMDALPGALRRLLSPRLVPRLPASIEPRNARRVRRFLAGLRHQPRPRYLSYVTIMGESLKQDLYSADMLDVRRRSNPPAFLEWLYDERGGEDFLAATMYADLLSYLPCDLLVKVDIASMANGLECRSPFLDHKVVEFCAGLPSDYNLRFGLDGLRGKRLLRSAFRARLPRAILRRGKMGFGVPVSAWFRNEFAHLLDEVLLGKRSLSRGYFRPEALRRLAEDHVACRADHGSALWALLMLELWHRTFIDCGKDVPTSPPVL